MPRPPDPLADAHAEFHGHAPDKAEAYPINGKDLENLWVLGRGVFIAYRPIEPSRYAGTQFVHHFGDHGDRDDASQHEQCPSCGMLHFKGQVPEDKLPLLGVTPPIKGRDGRMYQAIVIMGPETTVGAQGIKG